MSWSTASNAFDKSKNTPTDGLDKSKFSIFTRGLFSKHQFGFRVKRSTVMGILDLLDEIMDSFEGLECFSALFCDLSKAFDCVTHSLLLEKLKLYNFGEVA